MPISKAISRVLLIDDDPEELEILQEAICGFNPGIELSYTRRYSDFEQITEQNPPDIVLLDINMPESNGFEWLKRIRKLFPNLPVVMYSITSDEEKVDMSYNMGANLVLRKPMEFQPLIKALKSILEFDWQRPEEVKARYCRNGRYYSMA